MKLLDLFCGAGGAAMGYHRAGFEVVGVDIKPQPHYPFTFRRDDALSFAREFWSEFSVIHASPPCQAFSVSRFLWKKKYPDLITPLKEFLYYEQDLPFIIENVPNAPIYPHIILCGSQFNLYSGIRPLHRHRWFEIGNYKTFALIPPCQHGKNTLKVFGHSSERDGTMKERSEAMEINWMTNDELSQAIPPAYTQWIGRQLMRHLKNVKMVAQEAP